MKVSAIIAEYNPFHNGHKYHIEQTKRRTGALTAVIMSGSLVQRGEFALFSKHVRATAALLNGADLVLELPCVYSLSSAKRFASGAVELLNRLGAIDYLSFGSECGDLNRLEHTASLLERLKNSDDFKKFSKSGMSYPRALHAAARSASESAVLPTENPNDTLGLEYLAALKKSGSTIKPVVIKRDKSRHDGGANGNHASASFIRRCFEASEDAGSFLPENTVRLYRDEIQSRQYKIDPVKFDAVSMYALKSLTAEEFSRLPDVSEGLENRLYEAAKQAVRLEEFLQLVKTKRYTLSRLRRIAIYALMGITKEDQNAAPSYIRVLGMNDNGKKILAKAKKNASVEIHTAFSKIEKCGGRAAQLDRRATDLFNHLSYSPMSGGRDYYDNAVIF